MNWVPQQIHNAKFSCVLDSVPPEGDTDMQRLDLDGLPSCFCRDRRERLAIILGGSSLLITE